MAENGTFEESAQFYREYLKPTFAEKREDRPNAGKVANLMKEGFSKEDLEEGCGCTNI
jgi:hypothetical protein